MATIICGMVIALALFFALRHLYYNFKLGRSDCAGGCPGCSGGSCASCHPVLPKK